MDCSVELLYQLFFFFPYIVIEKLRSANLHCAIEIIWMCQVQSRLHRLGAPILHVYIFPRFCSVPRNAKEVGGDMSPHPGTPRNNMEPRSGSSSSPNHRHFVRGQWKLCRLANKQSHKYKARMELVSVVCLFVPLEVTWTSYRLPRPPRSGKFRHKVSA